MPGITAFWVNFDLAVLGVLMIIWTLILIIVRPWGSG